MSRPMMLAARLYGREDLRIEEVPRPEPGPGEVLLRTVAAALCGTDLRMFRAGHRRVSAERPLTLGHEIAGVIERLGPGVASYREGTPVVIAPNYGCGLCDRCTSGNTQLCERYEALGVHVDGGLAEYVLVPARAVAQGNLAEIPAGLGAAEACIAEPLSCVLNAAERYAVQPGDNVLVFGAGPVGLMHARVARMAAAATIFMSDINPGRLEMCRELEPGLVGLPSEGLLERVREATGGRGVEVCITACPAPEAQAAALEAAAVNGRVMFFGGLPEGRNRVSLDTNLIHYKQLWVSGTTRSNLGQYRRTLRLLASGLLRVRDLITHTAPLAGLPAMLAEALAGHGLKHVVLFDRTEGGRPAEEAGRRHAS